MRRCSRGRGRSSRAWPIPGPNTRRGRRSWTRPPRPWAATWRRRPATRRPSRPPGSSSPRSWPATSRRTASWRRKEPRSWGWRAIPSASSRRSWPRRCSPWPTRSTSSSSAATRCSERARSDAGRCRPSSASGRTMRPRSATRRASDDVLLVANENSPAQVVISGSVPAIERAEALAKEPTDPRGATVGRRRVPLAVDGAARARRSTSGSTRSRSRRRGSRSRRT